MIINWALYLIKGIDITGKDKNFAGRVLTLQPSILIPQPPIVRSSGKLKSWMIFYFLLILTTGWMGCSEAEKPATEGINSFRALQNHFQDPPAKYRSAPLWVWNDRITEEKIDRQLQQFKEEGIGGVFVHPRPGLITPYLSDRWHELYQYTVDRGKELDMKVWIYDENSYPSGFAGGHVPAEMPESVNQGQGLTLHQSPTLPDTAEEFHIILKETGESFTDITPHLGDASNEGSEEYYLFEKSYYDNAPWYGGYSYVDLLLDGVTEKFIEVTMEGYEQNFGDEFGKVVPGVFTDEPNISPPGGGKTIRWTPALFDKFSQRFGYDLKENLPSLFEEVGNWQKIRHDYYSLLLDLFIENWSKPWYEYTEKNDLKWTGHYWEHGWPNPGHGGDNMAMYAWHQVPGVDILFNNYQEDVDAQFGNVRAVKELSSIANQMGRNRALSETYGGGGWNLTFQDMKRIGDWEYVLGVNFLNQHLSDMTIKGARKRDYPQSFSYHEPWWENYDVLGDYFGRLSLALSAGEQVNKTLVIEPTTTAWMYYSPMTENENFKQSGDKFQQFLVDLEAEQVEYDLGSERIMREFGSVNNQALVVGERKYDLVVLPPGLKNLDQKTATLIEEYLSQGGQLLSYVGTPTHVDGETSDKFQILKSNYSDQWHQGNISGLSQNELLKADNFAINRQGNSGILFHRRMQLEEGELLFLVNTSENATGNVNMAGASVKKLNLVSGGITPYSRETTNEKVNFSFDIPPAGSLLLYIGNEAAGSKNGEKTNTGADTKVLTAEDSLNIQRLKSNTLTLDYCKLTMDGETFEEQYFFDAAQKVFQAHGFESNPWSRAVQYKRNILERNDFGEGSGFKATYSFSVDGVNEETKNDLQAVVERPRLWDISINGNVVKPIPEEWWLDRAFGKFNIGEHVREGKNQLTINAKKMTVFSELEPVYILGDFALESYSGGWQIIPSKPLDLGKWNKQGMPFYHQGVTYTKNYQLDPQEGTQYKVRLNEWKGTVATVHVNGEKAGIIGWPPYELDISENIQEGENEIAVKVIGSLKNLLGPHHNDPERWIASPWNFRDAPEQQPPGTEYDVIGYGLMEDFEVVKKD